MGTNHLSDDTFENQFATCTLEPTLFDHKAHLRLAWVHIRKYGVEQAIANVCPQIQRFDQTFDDGTKYHQTLTEAAIQVVHHFMGRTATDTFEGMLKEHPRLVDSFGDLVHAHYSKELLSTAEAKTNHVEPDLMAF